MTNPTSIVYVYIYTYTIDVGMDSRGRGRGRDGKPFLFPFEWVPRPIGGKIPLRLCVAVSTRPLSFCYAAAAAAAVEGTI